MPLPMFREVGSKKTFRAPYQASGIRFYGFFLDADPRRLADLCRDALGAPGSLEYRPAAPFVMLSFTEIAKIASTTEPDASQGFVPERESALWVLTIAEKRELGFDVAQHIAWYIPYIFVDSPNALLTGREVEGFPKEMAVVAVADVAKMSAQAWVFPKYAPTTEVSLATVAQATRNPAVEGAADVIWHSVEELVRGLERELFAGGAKLVLPGAGLLFSLVEGVIEREVSLVFLKQLRDVTDSAKACYQAIVEAPIKVTAFRGAGLLPGTYTIDLASFDSHPIVDQLGVIPDSMRTVKGFFVDFDFLLEQGKVVWDSGAGTT